MKLDTMAMLAACMLFCATTPNGALAQQETGAPQPALLIPMFEKLVAAGGTFDGISKGVFSATRMRLEVSRTWDGYRLYMGARTMDADPAYNGRVHWRQMVVVNTPTLVKVRRAMGSEVSGGYSNWEFRADAHGRLTQVVASWDSFLPDITTTVKFSSDERPVQNRPTAKAAVDTDPFADLASRP